MDSRKLFGFAVGVLLFLLTLVLGTYAFYTLKIGNTAVTFNIGDSYFFCETGKEFGTSSKDSLSLVPVLSYKSVKPQTFSVNNIGLADTKFSVTLNISEMTDVLKSTSFKYKLMVDKTGGSNECTTSNDCTEVVSGDFSSMKIGMNTIAPSIDLPNNSRYKYYLFVYIDGNMQNDSAMQNGSIKLTLEVCEIVVTLDYHYGNIIDKLEYLKVKSKYTGLPSDVTRNNTVITYDTHGGSSVGSHNIAYTFDGWYLENNYKNKVTADTEVKTTINHTLYAKWNQSWVESTSTPKKSDGVILPNTSKTGYTFQGWFLSSSGGSAVGQANSTYNNETSVTLHAQWIANKYTVTLDNQGATSSGTTSVSATYDSAMPKITPPSKSYTVTYNYNGNGQSSSKTTFNYSFGGYFTESNGNGTKYYNADGSSAKNYDIASNKTMYAKWTSTPITLPNPTWTGYTFNGWYDENGTRIADGGASYTPTANITLVAHWTANSYNISYSLNNGTKGSSSPTKVSYDTVATISNPAKTVTVTGNANGTNATVGSATNSVQNFLGWTATNLNTTTAYYGTSNTIVATNWGNTSTKVTAQYFKNLNPMNESTVTLTANWAPVGIKTPTLSKNGWTCNWNTVANGSGTKITPGEIFTPTATQGNQTLYAICNINSYVLTVKPNGGVYNGTTSDSTFTQKYATTKIVDNPEVNAYYTISYDGNGGTTPGDMKAYRAFLNWNLSGKGSFEGKTYTYGDGAGVLTANYNSTSNSISLGTSSKTFKITYNTNDSGCVAEKNSQSVNVVGQGWYTEASGGTKIANFGENVTLSGNIKLYAHWNENSESILLTNITKKGYRCVWNTKSDGTGESYYPGMAVVSFKKDTTLYAKSTILKTILTVDPNGGIYNGTNEKSTFSQNYGTTKTISIPESNAYYTVGYSIFAKSTYAYRPFLGWKLSGTGSFSNNVYTFGEPVNSSDDLDYNAGTLTATYNSTSSSTTLLEASKSFNIKYDINNSGGTSSKTSQLANVKGLGWYTASSGGTKVADFGGDATFSENVILYPHWSSNSDSQTIAEITKIGHTCKWNTKSDGSGIEYASKQTGVTFSESTTLYAICSVNSYTLTVNPNGGTYNNTAEKSIFSQNYGTIKTITDPETNAYYTINYNGNGGSTPSSTKAYRPFLRWNLSGKGIFSEGKYTYAEGDGILTADYDSTSSLTTLASPSKYYKITFDTNGTGATASSSSISVPVSGKGWYTSASDGTKIADFGGVTTFTKNTSLYAQWESKVSSIKLATITKTGYTCKWSKNSTDAPSDYGDEYASGATISIDSSITLYALCSKNSYTVTYDGNMFGAQTIANVNASGISISYDYSTSYLTITGTATKEIGIGLSNIPTLFSVSDQYKVTLTYVSGSYSGGFATFAFDVSKGGGADLSTRNYVDTPFPTSGSNSSVLTVSSVGVSEGKMLYPWLYILAGFSANNYKIKVDITKVYSKVIPYGSTYGDSYTPVRTGNTFQGWYTAESGGSQVSSTSISSIPSDHTLYAHWVPTNYTISFDFNGGTSNTSTVTATYNSGNYSDISWGLPTQTGCTFAGYYTSKTGGTQVYDSSGKAVNGTGYWISGVWIYTGNVTLYAHWNYSIDTNPVINGKVYGAGLSGFTYNVYVNGSLVAQNVEDYWASVPYGGTLRLVPNAKTGYNTTESSTTIYSVVSVSGPTWTRNFTCNPAGQTTTYAGKTWTTLSRDDTTCSLVLNGVSTATGTYNEAGTKLTSEYFTSGSTLLTEKIAGLVTYIGTDGGNTNVAGTYWINSSSVYDNNSYSRYSCVSSLLYYGYRGSGDYDAARATNCYTAPNVYETLAGGIRTGIASTASTYAVTNGAYSTATTAYTSFNVSDYLPEDANTSKERINIIVTRSNGKNKTDETWSSDGYLRIHKAQFYACGGGTSVHGQKALELTYKSGTQYTRYWLKYNSTGTRNFTADDEYSFAGRVNGLGIRPADGNNGTYVMRFDTASESGCAQHTRYTIGDKSVPIHYRLKINVKL